MKRFLCTLILVAVPSMVAATGYEIVITRTPDIASSVQKIDPIKDSLGHLRGLIYLTRVDFQRHVYIDLFERDSLVELPTWYPPVASVNCMHGDSIVVFLNTDPTARFDDSTTVYRFVLVGGTLSCDSLNLPLPHPDDYDSHGPVYQSIRFSMTVPGIADGIILGQEIEYVDTELGVGEIMTARYSITYLLDMDLSPDFVTALYTDLVSGRLDWQEPPQYIGFGRSYYDFVSPTMPEHIEGSAISLFRPNNPIGLQVHLPYGDHWLATAEIFPSQPYEEVVYYGNNNGLDSGRAISTDYLGCYNFSGLAVQELWYRPIAGIEPDRLFRRFLYLTAWRGDSVLLFIDAITGYTADSAIFDAGLEGKTTFSVSDDCPLYAAARIGDSVFVYSFDILIDVQGDVPQELPTRYALGQNYPNPFNASTEIVFALPRTSGVSITVYDLLGREVATLAEGRFGAGEHRVSWDGRDAGGAECASGVYLYRLDAGESSQSRKMVLLK